MKVRRILAFAVAATMMLTSLSAIGLVAAAAEADYYAVAFGHSGSAVSASTKGVFVGTGKKSSEQGNEDSAPYNEFTAQEGVNIASSRIGYISFSVKKPEIGKSVKSATVKLYVSDVNGNLGNGSMKLALYRTEGTPSSVALGGMNADEYLAVNDDYSYEAAYWTNEFIKKNNGGWKAVDVTKALVEAIEADKSEEENVTLSFRMQVPTAGLNIATAAVDEEYQPVLEVETGVATSVTIKYVDEDNNEITREDIENKFVGDSYTTSLPETVSDADGMTYILNDTDKTVELVAGENIIEVSYRRDAIVSAEKVTATTRAGMCPALPETIRVTLESGAEVTSPVIWEEMKPEDFTVESSPVEVEGFLTESFSVTAEVEVVDKESYVIAHYEFEDLTYTKDSSVEDSSDNSYTAVVKGGDLAVTEGVYDNGINLNGKGYIELPEELVNEIKDARAVTINTFVQKNKAQNQFLFSASAAHGSSKNKSVGIIDSYNFRYEANGDAITTGRRTSAGTEYAALTTVLDFEGGEGRLYINGDEVGSGKISQTFETVNAAVAGIGVSPWPDAYYNGYVDDFKIYSIALTEEEVAQISKKHTTTINYMAGETLIATEDFTAWGGQTIELTAKIQAEDGTWYNNDITEYVVDTAVDSVDIAVTADVNVVEITAAYTVEGVVIGEETLIVNKGEGASFAEKWYAENGGNYNYYSEGAVLYESAEIALEKRENHSDYEENDVIIGNDNDVYTVTTGENLIPNGDFSDGLTGWYRGNSSGTGLVATEEYFEAEQNGMVKTLQNGGTGSGKDLYRAWKVEKGKTYCFLVEFGTSNANARLSSGDDISVAKNADDNSGYVIKHGFDKGVNKVLFTANTDYVWVNFAWYGGSLVGNFALYEVAENTTDYSIVTIDNEKTFVKKSEKFTLPENALMYYETEASGGTVYLPETEVIVTEDMTFTSYNDTGLKMVDGAQVRIGKGVNEENKVGYGSGIRFITTINQNDTIASVTGAEFGVEITAESSSVGALDIPAVKWQEEGVIYTSAITNLAESNFNRKFTATPYVKLGELKFYGTPVTRSIYQVAAGLLVNDDADNTEYDESALQSEILYKVLNAYVNQTGIRLHLRDGGDKAYSADDVWTARTEGQGAYTGDAFFNVKSAEYDESGVYTVVLEAAGEKTAINMSYWREYIRINNNNSQVKVATELTDNADGTYTLTLDTRKLG